MHSPSIYHAANASFGAALMYSRHCARCERGMVLKKFRILCPMNAFRASALTCSSLREHIGGQLERRTGDKLLYTSSSLLSITSEPVMQAQEDQQDLSLDIESSSRSCFVADSSYDSGHSAKASIGMSKKEIERRRKIGSANKGKVPWNKGRKHSEETRERIKRRTREALSNPKIRKKMFGSPRSHSDQSKAKISSALRSIWEERLKHRMLQETCYLMWQRSIAAAAKEGGHGERQLDWDSFHKIKAELVSQQLQWKADKGSAKQIAKLRAEIVARVRAEKAARLADQMDDKEDNTNAKVVEALPRKKSEGERKNIALRKSLKLKERLSKFHHRKKQLEKLISSKKKVAVSPKPVIDERDIEIIKSGKPRARVSLANQIRAAKIVKAKLASERIPVLASSNIPLEENSSGF